jgi:hypothetical protein
MSLKHDPYKEPHDHPYVKIFDIYSDDTLDEQNNPSMIHSIRESFCILDKNITCISFRHCKYNYVTYTTEWNLIRVWKKKRPIDCQTID